MVVRVCSSLKGLEKPRILQFADSLTKQQVELDDLKNMHEFKETYEPLVISAWKEDVDPEPTVKEVVSFKKAFNELHLSGYGTILPEPSYVNLCDDGL